MATEVIDGGKEIRKQLDELPKRLRTRTIGRALRAATKPVIAKGKQFAPEDTGVLKRNIVAVAWRSRVYTKVFAIGVDHGPVPENVGEGLGAVTSRSGKVSVRKLSKREKRGEDPFYWRWQETGWKHIKTGREIKGKFFLKRGLEETKDEAEKIYADIIKSEIQKIGKPA